MTDVVKVLIRPPAPVKVVTRPPALVVHREVGARGERGPAGIDGQSPQPYVHLQATPAATWTVAHNLNRAVQVTVLDSSGAEMDADVEHGDLNTVTVTHAAPDTGSVIVT